MSILMKKTKKCHVMLLNFFIHVFDLVDVSKKKRSKISSAESINNLIYLSDKTLKYTKCERTSEKHYSSSESEKKVEREVRSSANVI